MIDIYNAVIEAFCCISTDISSKEVTSVTNHGVPSVVGTTSGFMQLFFRETIIKSFISIALYIKKFFVPRKAVKNLAISSETA